MRTSRTVLFMGDSITDADRNRTGPRSLGDGYVRQIADRIRQSYGDKWVVLNRGISGDRSDDIARRWESDCLAEHPDAVSLLVGVNDTWRRFDSDDPRDVGVYEADLRTVLTHSRRAGIERLILIEPFFLHVPPVTFEWDEEMAARRQVIAQLAEEFDAVNVRAQHAFDRAPDNPSELLVDGVHPTDQGHAILARAWMDAVPWLAE
jgi:acyl-CoA thioesterase-1